MTIKTVRSLSVAIALTAAAAAAQALTIPTNALVADSVQKFSATALQAFGLFGITVTAKGNATPVEGTTDAFKLPITSITVGSGLHIAAGDAKGSALEIARIDAAGVKKGVTLANFTINYDTQQVLADTTPVGGVTVRQAPVYTFVANSALAIKYKFPLTITGHEELGTLKLVPTAVETLIVATDINPFLANAVVPQIDFGTLTQDILIKFRKAVSTKPYEAQ